MADRNFGRFGRCKAMHCRDARYRADNDLQSVHICTEKKVSKMTKIDIISGFLGAGKTTFIKQLLKEARYTTQDYLIIDGDFVEKGTQAIETVHYLQYLQQKSPRVYVLLGNCEYALDALINDDDLCQEMLHYLRKIGKSGMIDQIVSRKHLDLKKEKPQILQKIVRESLQEELNYIASLPTSIETDDFLCIHAGIENKNDWQNAPLSSFIEKRDFQKVGHCLKKYVIVGHLPTSNFYQNQIKNDVLMDFDKKIISIDGGTGVKFISQLNALIIENDGKNLTFKNHFVQPLPIYRIKQDKFVENKENHKVSWPNFEIEILEKREEFSFCKVIHTNQMLWIKNEFIYLKNKHFYCLDDYIDHFITVHENEDVKVIGLYGKFAYIIKNKEIGWIESGYLEKI